MKTKKTGIYGLPALCAAGLMLALASTPTHLKAQTDDYQLAESNLNEANNGFAFDLLKEIAAEEPKKDIFISPFSVSTVMQMVSEGAAGRTKSEIQAALKTAPLPTAELNVACGQIYDSLHSYEKARLNLADGIWYQNTYRLNPGYASVIRDTFHAELAPVDFKNPAAANLINEWAARHTEGRINGVVSFPFPRDTELVLADAIYFKGKWEDPFDKSMTRPRSFYLPDSAGAVKQVPMMRKHDSFNYEENDRFQAVQLFYEGGLQMSLFLPKGHASPRQLLRDFSSGEWSGFISDFSSRDGMLVLPKFKFDCKILLNTPLKSLGINEAFDDVNANFSPMTATGPLYIKEVAQKSFVAVDEEGAEAAAVTSAMTAPTLGIPESPPKPFEMIVDHPFLFVISAWGPYQTQVILFMGIVNDPDGTS